MAFDFKSTSKEIGDFVSGIFNNILNFVAENLGVEITTLQEKLIAIIILLIPLYFILKIAKSTTKIVLIIITGVLIISTFFSIF